MALSKLHTWTKHSDDTMNVRVVATNKEVVTFIEDAAEITGFDDNSPPRPYQHLRLDRGIPNTCARLAHRPP